MTVTLDPSKGKSGHHSNDGIHYSIKNFLLAWRGEEQQVENLDQQMQLFDTRGFLPSADTHRLNLLALSRVRGIGEVSLKAFIKKYKNLDAIWDASLDELRHVASESGLKLQENVLSEIVGHRQKLEEDATQELGQLSQKGIQLITDLDKLYPKQLLDIDDPPKWLFVQGDVSTLSLPNLIAVVGTREASAQGVRRARRLTQWLAERGFGIVSGLAEGIDEVAHQTALDCGTPTIAVLGTGIFITFPVSTGHLREKIITTGGAIITEYFPNDSYSRQRFVRRNRIQAGLAYATVPVEAREQSGTAHTYRFARNFKRKTFGVISKEHPAPNGILDLLRKDERPIFNLDSQTSMNKLEAELRSAFPNHVSHQITKSPFQLLMHDFERIINAYTITEDDFSALKVELDRKWEEVRRGDQSSSA
jgi:DNA processing protein